MNWWTPPRRVIAIATVLSLLITDSAALAAGPSPTRPSHVSASAFQSQAFVLKIFANQQAPNEKIPVVEALQSDNAFPKVPSWYRMVGFALWLYVRSLWPINHPTARGTLRWTSAAQELAISLQAFRSPHHNVEALLSLHMMLVSNGATLLLLYGRYWSSRWRALKPSEPLFKLQRLSFRTLAFLFYRLAGTLNDKIRQHEVRVLLKSINRSDRKNQVFVSEAREQLARGGVGSRAENNKITDILDYWGKMLGVEIPTIFLFLHSTPLIVGGLITGHLTAVIAGLIPVTMRFAITFTFLKKNRALPLAQRAHILMLAITPYTADAAAFTAMALVVPRAGKEWFMAFARFIARKVFFLGRYKAWSTTVAYVLRMMLIDRPWPTIMLMWSIALSNVMSRNLHLSELGLVPGLVSLYLAIIAVGLLPRRSDRSSRLTGVERLLILIALAGLVAYLARMDLHHHGLFDWIRFRVENFSAVAVPGLMRLERRRYPPFIARAA